MRINKQVFVLFLWFIYIERSIVYEPVIISADKRRCTQMHADKYLIANLINQNESFLSLFITNVRSYMNL